MSLNVIAIKGRAAAMATNKNQHFSGVEAVQKPFFGKDVMHAIDFKGTKITPDQQCKISCTGSLDEIFHHLQHRLGVSAISGSMRTEYLPSIVKKNRGIKGPSLHHSSHPTT
jgi:hypothetical protein